MKKTAIRKTVWKRFVCTVLTVSMTMTGIPAWGTTNTVDDIDTTAAWNETLAAESASERTPYAVVAVLEKGGLGASGAMRAAGKVLQAAAK